MFACTDELAYLEILRRLLFIILLLFIPRGTLEAITTWAVEAETSSGG